MLWIFFVFKQKTAYEMRISDWSSDVCSSDLKTDSLLNRHTSIAQGSKPLRERASIGRKNPALPLWRGKRRHANSCVKMERCFMCMRTAARFRYLFFQDAKMSNLLKPQLSDAVKAAMRAKDSDRLGTLRFLLAAIKIGRAHV